jgi:hypothetical protein
MLLLLRRACSSHPQIPRKPKPVLFRVVESHGYALIDPHISLPSGQHIPIRKASYISTDSRHFELLLRLIYITPI